MNIQKMFDQAVGGIVKQGCQSTGDWGDGDDDTNGCMYRGPNGTKCAIGHVITDEFYSEKLEGLSLSDSTLREALDNSLACRMPRGWLNLLSGLQSVHDNPDLGSLTGKEFVSMFLAKANILAEQFYLTPYVGSNE